MAAHIAEARADDADAALAASRAEVEALRAEVDALKAEMDASNKARKALAEKLRAVAYSVTTRKALAAALPEFEKYLPPDDAAAIRTLPVVANVVADFVKAGWPKGKKPATV